jgi:hypothetical protein
MPVPSSGVDRIIVSVIWGLSAGLLSSIVAFIYILLRLGRRKRNQAICPKDRLIVRLSSLCTSVFIIGYSTYFGNLMERPADWIEAGFWLVVAFFPGFALRAPMMMLNVSFVYCALFKLVDDPLKSIVYSMLFLIFLDFTRLRPKNVS